MSIEQTLTVVIPTVLSSVTTFFLALRKAKHDLKKDEQGEQDHVVKVLKENNELRAKLYEEVGDLNDLLIVARKEKLSMNEKNQSLKIQNQILLEENMILKQKIREIENQQNG